MQQTRHFANARPNTRQSLIARLRRRNPRLRTIGPWRRSKPAQRDVASRFGLAEISPAHIPPLC